MFMRRKASHLLASVGHVVKHARYDTKNSPLRDDLSG